jgi:prepilin-type N-terminal cleavage/methylation domain-containing protein
MRTARLSRGFTLVEIMIVVAIIGILSSVAIPEMGKATLRARAAERRTMMTAIAHAMSDYMVNTNVAAPSMTGAWNPTGTATTSKRPFNPMLDDGWKLLCRSLQVEGFTYYSYKFVLDPNGSYDDPVDGTPKTGTTLVVQAVGDLDGDGSESPKTITYLGFGNAFAELLEDPEAGAEDQGTF